jgi:hypothetical protein
MTEPNVDSQKPPETPAPTFDTLIPDEFKDRKYLDDLKTLPVGPDGYKALFKKLDGAQTLIGKKTGVPAADAPAEEWDKFHESLRPGKADEYELANAQDPEAAKAIKGIFHEAGLTKSQAAKLAAKFDAFVGDKTKAQKEEAEKLDAEFATLTEKTFGADNIKVLERSKELLQALTPDNLKPYLVKLPNESLVLLAGVMESVRAKFMKEDNMDGKGGAGAGASDVSSLRDQARKLMDSPAWKNSFDKDHTGTKAKVDEIYTAIARLTAAGGK